MATLLAVTHSKFDQLGPQAVSNLLWSLCKLGVVPDRTWLTQFYKASQQVKVSKAHGVEFYHLC